MVCLGMNLSWYLMVYVGVLVCVGPCGCSCVGVRVHGSAFCVSECVLVCVLVCVGVCRCLLMCVGICSGRIVMFLFVLECVVARWYVVVCVVMC